MSRPFIKTYDLQSERSGQTQRITLALYPDKNNPAEGEVFATWVDNGVLRPMEPDTFATMSIRTLTPSNKLHDLFSSFLRQHYYEYEQEVLGGEPS